MTAKTGFVAGLRNALIAVTVLLPLAGAAQDPLRVAAVPGRETVELEALYGPTVRLLERKLGIAVRLAIARDYDDLTQRIVQKAADIGFYGSASYVLAKRHFAEIRYLATVNRPDDHYFSLVFVKQDSSFKDLADARERSIGMTDLQSTSGYLVPRAMFAHAGIKIERDARVFLLRRHSRVFDAVAAGNVEFGAADAEAWDAAEKKHGKLFRLIARSAPIPRDPVVVAPHVDATLAKRIQRILADARKDPQFASESTALTGYSVYDDRFYDMIRKITL